MGNGTKFVDEILHASRYDPVKAHEYYLRTRELKGRRSSADLSDAGKERWAYTKNEVGEERKGSLKNASEKYKEHLEEIREEATKRREELSAKMRAIMDRISQEATDTREDISAKVEAEIEALPDMPKNLTKQQRAEFSAKRKEEIAKIRGEAESKRTDVKVWTKARRGSEQKSAKTQREDIASKLSTSIEEARKGYEKAREAIKAEFEGELDKEFEAAKADGGSKKRGRRR